MTSGVYWIKIMNQLKKKLNKWKQYQQPAIIQLPNIQPNKLTKIFFIINLPVKIKRYKILCNDKF